MLVLMIGDIMQYGKMSSILLELFPAVLVAALIGMPFALYFLFVMQP